MRRVFFLLLLGNVALLAWELRHLEPPAAPTAAPPAAVPGERSYVNRLLLLSEVDPAELRERAPLIPALAEPAAAPAGEPPESGPSGAGEAEPLAARCFSIGPIETPEEVEALDAWLAGLGASTRARVGERREIALYWIYFPPLATRADAVARVGTMRAEGIDDIYIIPRGDMANAISLGVYSRRRSLDRRLAELREKGYEPSIAPRYRTRKASWIDAALRAPFEFPRAEFVARFPTTDYLAVPCRPEQVAALRALPEPAVRAAPIAAPMPGSEPGSTPGAEPEPAGEQRPVAGEARPSYLRSGLTAAPPAAGRPGPTDNPPSASAPPATGEDGGSGEALHAAPAPEPIDPVH